jgi:hypothetical protein
MKLVPAQRALLFALLVASGCGGDGTSKGVNSNTNWLLACETPDDCGGAWDCLCGVCTAACEDSCPASGGVCTRTGSLAHGLQCGDSEASAVCLRGCDDGGEPCAADQVCVNAVCSARPEPVSCSEHSAALFCSGFERDDLDAGTLADGAALEQTTEEQLGGDGALAAAVQAPAVRSRARYDFAPQTEGTLYLRAWLYLDIADASDLHVHTLTVGSVDTGAYGTNLHIDGGKLGLSFPSRGDVAGDASVPARTWFCARLEIALAAEDGAVSVWLNDELSAEASDADTLPPEGVVNISVGIDAADASNSVRLLVDDIVLATTPVACDH